MGPRSRERGNILKSLDDRKDIDALQWGRAHVSAEIYIRMGQQDGRVVASMGPRSRERGNRRLCFWGCF